MFRVDHTDTTHIGPTMTSSPLRILAIPGSLRAGSFNHRLLLAAAELAPDGVEVEVYEQLADVPLFNQDHEDPAPAGVTALRERVAASDAILIATPEYNGSIPGVLKNTLDWLSRGETEVTGVRGRPVAVIGTTPGMWGTKLAQEHARQILSNMGAKVEYGARVYLARASAAFDGDALVDDTARTALTAVLRSLAEHAEQAAERVAAA